MSKIAIFGFGRIGRSTLRVALRSQLFVPSHIADIADIESIAAIFEVDTNYGRWPEPVTVTADNEITIGDRKITYLNTNRTVPDWKELGIDVVIDCTGMSTTRSGAQRHLDQGAKLVLVSAPSKTVEDADAVLLPGVNIDHFDPDHHRIVSMASCTTNALAPVVKTLIKSVGIETALFSTVHAYTNTQSLTDQPMSDRRDSWAAAENVIPSPSGAAKALQFIWPDLNITGKAYRVPMRTVSIAEVNAVTTKSTSPDELKDIFRTASTKPVLQGVMSVLEEEWASSRILGDSHSSIVDLPLTQVVKGNLISVAAWYDNEMGYATRLAETAKLLASSVK